MSVLLPQPRLPQKAVPKLLDWGADQKAPQGGGTQRLNRLGNRFAIEISYPRLRQEPDGRVLSSALRRAKTEGARFAFPQPGLEIGTPGSPVVRGSGQLGSTIALGGFVPGYVVRDGQFFSIVHGGRRYLHCASADRTADASGNLSLPIHPMLRVSPANGATCEFGQPYIEGLISGAEVPLEWTIAKAMVPTIVLTEQY